MFLLKDCLKRDNKEDENKNDISGVGFGYKGIFKWPPEGEIKNEEFELLKKLYATAEESHQNDRALGSVLGAFIGDALGAPLEFTEKITENNVDHSLKMSGGGPFKVAPSQVTDDSEMALSLANGLTHDNLPKKTPGCLDLNLITESYREWIKSIPFDVGVTTQLALNLGNFEGMNTKDYYGRAVEASENMNRDSLSNGALMRITPLAVWCLNLKSKEEIFKAVELENKITHSNMIVCLADFIYVLAIRWLIKKEGDIKYAYRKINGFLNSENDPNWEEIKNWWMDAHKPLMPAYPNIGYMKIAWTYALSTLIHPPKDYLTGMMKILLKGGDTDTNACIYGGMLGAIFGLKGLSKDLVAKLLNCKHENHKRPAAYHPKTIVNMLANILKIGPRALIYKTSEADGFKSLRDLKSFLKTMEKLAGDEKSLNDKILGLCFGLFMRDIEQIHPVDPAGFEFLEPILRIFNGILRHRKELTGWLGKTFNGFSFKEKIILMIGIKLLILNQEKQEAKFIGILMSNNEEDLWKLTFLAVDLIFCEESRTFGILEKIDPSQENKFDFGLLKTILVRGFCEGSPEKLKPLTILSQANQSPLILNVCGGFLGLIFGFRSLSPKFQNLEFLRGEESFIFYHLYPVLRNFIKHYNRINKILP